jgi:type III secretory pathway component EscU
MIIDPKVKKISPADFAWQCESLTSLIELIKENKDESIEAVFNKI